MRSLISGCSMAILLLSFFSALSYAENNMAEGEAVFKLLLKNYDYSLADEPVCESYEIFGKVDTLGQYLSSILSLSYGTENTVTISSSCGPSKHETKANKVIDVLMCQLVVTEIHNEAFVHDNIKFKI